MGWIERMRQWLKTSGGSFVSPDPGLVNVGVNTRYTHGLDLYQGEGGAGANLRRADVMGSSTVQACVDYIFKAAQTADLVVDVNGRETDNHPLLDLLARPRRATTHSLFLQRMLESFMVTGNSLYEIKLGNRPRMPVELHFIPYRRITIKDGQYHIGGKYSRSIPFHRILHLRYKLAHSEDDQSPGVSPLSGLVLAEIALDAAMVDYSLTLMENMGNPGYVIMPKEGDVEPTPEQIEQAERAVDSARGRRRGRGVALSGHFDVVQLNSVLDRVGTKDMRQEPQASICRVLGVPQILVLEGSQSGEKYGAARREARIEFQEHTVGPLLINVAEQLTQQLLWRFYDDREIDELRYVLPELAIGVDDGGVDPNPTVNGQSEESGPA